MRIIIIAIIMLAAQATFAQDFDRLLYVSWDVNKPLANTGDWIENNSRAGLRIGYRKFINERFTVGGDVSWAYYKQYEPQTTFVNPDGAITTDYFKYTYSYSLTLNGQYFLPVKSEHILPFAGVGLGAVLNRDKMYYNVYVESDDSWGFLARPEVGVLIPFSRKIGLIAAAHYDFTTAKSDYFNLSSASNLGVNVGLIFTSY